ncbi:Uncharacterised protein [Legionella busanensis]|uniref:Uncharacterized protein n=1 Tax=Legionella busanensis TaxID=190655 RepID=A0A378JNK6_9GAMM|nr:hypothetical protein [Legionella busanensis]STX51580.1 Uncharacterised protein [Legionella busanensis]
MSQDKVEDKGRYIRIIKSDYYVIILSNQEMDATNIAEVSKKNNHVAIIIIQDKQVKIYGYHPTVDNIAPGEWRLQQFWLPENLLNELKNCINLDNEVQNLIKLSELPLGIQQLITENHQEVHTKRKRVPTLDDEKTIGKITKEQKSLKPFHTEVRQQHFFHEASLKPSKQSMSTQNEEFKIPYIVAIQGTNYKVRRAEKVIKEISWTESSLTTTPSKAEIDVSSIRMENIPTCVQNFNPNDTHTLFIPSEGQTKEDKVQQALDMRLGGPLKGLLRSCGEQGKIEAFLGATKDMINFYRSRGYELVEEIWFPSTGRYYTFFNKANTDFVITLGAIQSQANLISQLLTLKMAAVNVEHVKVYGDTKSVEHEITQDILKFKEKIIAMGINLAEQNTALVIAGNGEIIGRELEKLKHDIDIENKITSDPGSRCVMTYYPLKQAKGSVQGIINLSMPYGEVMGPMLTDMADFLNVREVFLAGIGGAINKKDEKLEEKEVERHIGTYHVFFKTTNPENGMEYILDRDEVIMPPIEQKCLGWLNNEKQALHVHVDSPFIETFTWLEKRIEEGCTIVDCETFFAIERIKEWNDKHPEDKIHIMPGLLVSDYVGHKSLEGLTPDTCKHVRPFIKHFIKSIKAMAQELSETDLMQLDIKN